jgi:hypothetical protein
MRDGIEAELTECQMARCPAHEALGSAMRPAARATGRPYSDRVSGLGRDEGGRAFSAEPGPWCPGEVVGPYPRHPGAHPHAGGRVAGARHDVSA